MPPVVDPDRCIGCEICERHCPIDVFTMVPFEAPKVVLGRKAKAIVDVTYPDECWHCGVCRLDCPTEAISYVFPEDMLNLRWAPDTA